MIQASIDLGNSHFLHKATDILITARLRLDITKPRDEFLALVSVAARARTMLCHVSESFYHLREKLRMGGRMEMDAEEIAG